MVQYKTNFLTNVIFRIDYPEVIELNDKSSLSKIQEKLNDTYPLFSEIHELRFDANIDNIKETIDIKKEAKSLWQFSNKKSNKKIILGSKFMVLEFNEYNNFSELAETIKFVINDILSKYPIKVVNKIEFRYINQIKLNSGNPFHWEGYVSQKLLPKNNFLLEHELCKRYMHMIEYKYNEYNVFLQYGLYNPEYPNEISKKELLLDIDCYSKELTDIELISQKAEKLHEIISNLFERAIDTELKKELMKDG